MRRIIFRSRIALIALGTFGAVGCGSSGSGTPNAGPSSSLQCPSTPGGLAKIVGTLDGKAVGVSESPAPGGFFQVPSGSLTIPIVPTFSGQDAGTDPTMLYVQLNWGGLVADGASAAATGTLTLPAGQPLGGMALCAGAGTSISPASDGSLAFEFAGLTLAPGCTQAVTGSLAGCWNPSN